MDASQVAILAFGIPILIAESVMCFRIYLSDCSVCHAPFRTRCAARARPTDGAPSCPFGVQRHARLAVIRRTLQLKRARAR